MSERLELGTWKLRKDRHRYDGGLFAPRPAPVQEGSTRFQERTSYMYSGGAVRERPSTLSQRYPPQRNPVGRHWIAARITPANAVLDVCAYLDCHYGRTLSYYVQPEKDQWSHSAMDISNSFLNQFEKNRQFIETQDCVNVYIQFASSTVALTVIDNGHFEFNNEVKTRTAVKAPQVPYGAQYTSVSVDIAPCTELGFLEKLKKVEEDKKRDMVFTSAETVVEKEKTSADISPVSSRSDDSSLPAQTSSSSDKGAEAPSAATPHRYTTTQRSLDTSVSSFLPPPAAFANSVVPLYCTPIMRTEWCQVLGYHVFHLVLFLLISVKNLFGMLLGALVSSRRTRVVGSRASLHHQDDGTEDRPLRVIQRLGRFYNLSHAIESMLHTYVPFLPTRREVDVLLWAYLFERKSTPEKCVLDLYTEMQLAKPYNHITSTNGQLHDRKRGLRLWRLLSEKKPKSEATGASRNALKFIVTWKARPAYTLYTVLSFWIFISLCFLYYSYGGPLQWISGYPDQTYVYEYEKRL